MAVSSKKNDPSNPSLFYQRMIARWNLIGTVLGGTETMRESGEELLPKHMHEPSDVYDERLATSVFLNMTELTLDFLTGKPFSEPIVLMDDVPEVLKEYMEDVDLQGNNLDHFAQQVFREGMAKGFTHVLVETPSDNGSVRTLADQRIQNVRPYWVHIVPENLIAAEAIRVNGLETLTHVRFFETEVVRDGFEESEEHYVRVMDLVDLIGDNRPEDFRVEVRRYKKTKKSQNGVNWELDGPPRMTDLKSISLVTFYTNRTGFMESKPPLLDLAHLNVTHWQSGSDQRSILTVSRFPMLAGSGITDYENEKTIVGPHGLLLADDPQGRFYYVEHSGAAINVGRQDLKDLEEAMALYGAQLLKPRPDRETATARSLDEAATTSNLQRMTFSFMDVLEQLLLLTAQMIGKDEGGTVRVNTDFSLNETEIVDLQTLVTARKDREISHEAFIAELKRRGVLHEDFSAEDDLKLLFTEKLPEPPGMNKPDPANARNPVQGGGKANQDEANQGLDGDEMI